MLRWRFKRDLALGLSFLCLSAVAINSGNVSAVDGDVQVEIGITPVIQITVPQRVMINAKPGGPFAKAKMPITVKTNSLAGYSESISVNHYSDGEHDDYYKSLVNVYDSSYTISALTDTVSFESNFPVDQWGCATGEDSRYRALSTADSPSIRYMTNNANGDETHNLICGARVSKIKAAGIYNNTILVNVVANVLPETIMTINYMQEVNDTVIASMGTDQSYQLVDGRDQKIYWVTKMRDGNVWMTQNLDYDLDAAGRDVYSWNYDYSSRTYQHYLDGGDLYYDVDDGQMKNANELPINSEKLHYHVGSYYTLEHWREALSDNTLMFTASTYGQICPFAWAIPSKDYSYGSFDALKIAYNQGISGAFYMAPMGYVDSDGQLTDVGDNSYYIDRSRYSSGTLINASTGNYIYDSIRALNIDGTMLVSDTKTKDNIGGFIRCVARPGYSYGINYYDYLYITYNSSSLPSVPKIASFSKTETLTPVSSITDLGLEIPDGYEFLGWTDNSNELTTPTITSVTLNDNSAVKTRSDELLSSSKNIYATWEHKYTKEVIPVVESYEETRTIDDITYLQDITPEIVTNTAMNASKQLVDSRDGKTYWVRKLSDGNIWMEQNLDLDFSEERTLTPEDSNVAINRTIQSIDEDPTVADSTYFSTSSNMMFRQRHYENGTGFDSISDLDETDVKRKGAVGSKYNYYTVLAGSLTTYDNSENINFTESICPKGWKLPSGYNNSDVFYYDVYPVPDDYVFNGGFATDTVVYNIDRIISPSTSGFNSIHTIDRFGSGYNFIYARDGRSFNVRCVSPKTNPAKTLENISSMHEMTPEVCRNTPVGTEVRLTDERDGKKYFVGKLSDGNCWMLQNLALGFEYEDGWTGLDRRLSDVTLYNAETYIGTVSSGNCDYYKGCYKILKNTYYDGHLMSLGGNIPQDSYFNKGTIGGLYEHYMVTTAEYTSSSNQAYLTRSICPRGWRLPTRNDPVIPNENGARDTLGYYRYASNLNNPDTNLSRSNEYYYWINEGYGSGRYHYGYYYSYYYNSYSTTSNRLLPVRCIAR